VWCPRPSCLRTVPAAFAREPPRNFRISAETIVTKGQPMPTKSKPKPPTPAAFETSRRHEVNRRRLVLEKDSHTPAPDPLPPPPHLSPSAAQVWRETVVHLAARGAVNPADAITLETFVAAVLRQRPIAAEIEAAPLLDDEGKLSPLLRYAASTEATVKGLAAALGLNAAGRQRLPMAPQKQGGGKWADLP
jgi:P27 family predicted phage terminase small subunit